MKQFLSNFVWRKVFGKNAPNSNEGAILCVVLALLIWKKQFYIISYMCMY